MFSIARAVEAAAQTVSVELRECPVDAQQRWKASVLKSLHLPSLDKLWADGVWEGAVLTDEPWRWIRELRGRGPYVLFFPTDNSKAVFQAESAAELAQVLDAVDVAAFDFGLSRIDGDFALVKFSEGGLRGFGTVVDWLNAGSAEPLDLDAWAT
jgi:hypothetical protein